MEQPDYQMQAQAVLSQQNSTPVYVSGEVEASQSNVEEILAEVSTQTGESIAAVIVSSGEVDPALKDPTLVAQELAEANGYDTVIIIGENTDGSANVALYSQESTNLKEIFLQQYVEGQPPAENFTDTITDILSQYSSYSTTVDSAAQIFEVPARVDFSPLTSSEYMLGMGLIVGLPLTLTLVAATAASFITRKHIKILENKRIPASSSGPSGEIFDPRKALEGKKSRKRQLATYNSSAPEHVRELLLDIDIISSDKIVPKSVAEEVDEITDNLQELFQRIAVRGTVSQARVAEVEYTNRLEKLKGLLGEDYYLDILRNPRLWDSPEKRISQIDQAIKALDAEVISNIRKINSSNDLEFTVVLETLIGNPDQLTIEDIYKSRKTVQPEATKQKIIEKR